MSALGGGKGARLKRKKRNGERNGEKKINLENNNTN